MHCRVTSDTGMKTVDAFRVHDPLVEAEEIGPAAWDVEPLVLQLERSAVEGVLRVERLVLEVRVRPGIPLREGEDAVVIRPEELGAVLGEGARVRATREGVELVGAGRAPVLRQERPFLGDDAGDAGCGGDQDRLLLVCERNRLLLRAVGERTGHLRAEREATCAAGEDGIERRERRRSP